MHNVVEKNGLLDVENWSMLSEPRQDLLWTLPHEIPAQVAMDNKGAVDGRNYSQTVCGDFRTAHFFLLIVDRLVIARRAICVPSVGVIHEFGSYEFVQKKNARVDAQL